MKITAFNAFVSSIPDCITQSIINQDRGTCGIVV